MMTIAKINRDQESFGSSKMLSSITLHRVPESSGSSEILSTRDAGSVPKRRLTTSRVFLRLVLGLAASALLVSAGGTVSEDSANPDDIRNTLPQDIRYDLEQRYNLTDKGVLPSRCLRRLPTYFNDWEIIADDLPELNQKNELRAAVDRLPLLDYKQLKTGEEMRRAQLILGMISSSYLNCLCDCLLGKWIVRNPDADGDDVEDKGEQLIRDFEMQYCDVCSMTGRQNLKILPKQLAEPYHHTAEENGLVPILTHVLTDEWNFCKKYEDEPISLHNLELTASMTGTVDEQYFHLVVTAMMHAARELPVMMLYCPQAIQEGNDKHLILTLRKAAEVLKEWNKLFAEAFQEEYFSREVFHQVLRPCFTGFDKVGGVTFEMSGGDKVLRWSGPSAGQNCMIMMFDAILCVEHEPMNKEWFKDMHNYITTPERKMVLDFQENCSKNSLVTYTSQSSNIELRRAYNGMMRGLNAFRGRHIEIAEKYIGDKDAKGTGGTPWRTQLDKGKGATKSKLSKCPFASMARLDRLSEMPDAHGPAKCPMAAHHEAGAKCPVTHASVHVPAPASPYALEAAGSPPAAAASGENELEVNSSSTIGQKLSETWASAVSSVRGLLFQSKGKTE